jgi:hypothetical protein
VQYTNDPVANAILNLAAAVRENAEAVRENAEAVREAGIAISDALYDADVDEEGMEEGFDGNDGGS